MSSVTIPSAVNRCFDAFDSLCKAAESGSDLSLALQEERGRFKIWTANISAHRAVTSRRSLEYRLRDSSNLRDTVKYLLQDLLQALQALADVAPSSHDLNSAVEVEANAFVDEDDDFDFGTGAFTSEDEEQRLLEDIHDVVNCLMRFSMTLRNPARQDHMRYSANSNAQHYAPYDREHVRSKYPEAPDYLVDRLGKSISRHRLYFDYRKQHHAKLAEGLEHRVDQGEGTVHEQASTIATSVHKDVGRAPRVHDSDDESVYTATSFASSASGQRTLRPPPLPAEGENGDPFECKICFTMVIADNERAWRQHVYEDLPPYVCMQESCATAHQPYARRREWQQHERDMHQRTWACPYGCHDVLATSELFQIHVVRNHDQKLEDPNMHRMIDACAQPLGDESATSHCPLCQKMIVPQKRFFKHLGHHLEELALFSLPSHLHGDESDAESDGSNASGVLQDANDVQREIDSREEQLDSGTMTLVDEKKALAELSQLKRLKQACNNLTAAAIPPDHGGESGEEESDEDSTEETLITPPILFNDGVGRKFRFPWKKCKTWEGMEILIKQAFMPVARDFLSEHVHKGQYDLIGSDGQIILPQVWNTMVRPGEEVTMHMWPMPEREERNLNEDVVDVASQSETISLPPLSEHVLVGSVPAHVKRQRAQEYQDANQDDDSDLPSLFDSVPRAQESVPPPLPSPSYIPEMPTPPDAGWPWGNDPDSSNFRYAPRGSSPPTQAPPVPDFTLSFAPSASTHNISTTLSNSIGHGSARAVSLHDVQQYADAQPEAISYDDDVTYGDGHGLHAREIYYPVSTGSDEYARQGTEPGTGSRTVTTSYWSVTEQQDFVKYVSHFGTDFVAIAAQMGTKTSTMIENHYLRQIETQSDLETAAREADKRRNFADEGDTPPAQTSNAKRHNLLPLQSRQPPFSHQINLKYLELETLKHYNIPYEFNLHYPGHVNILREGTPGEASVPVLFEHTRKLREERNSRTDPSKLGGAGTMGEADDIVFVDEYDEGGTRFARQSPTRSERKVHVLDISDDEQGMDTQATFRERPILRERSRIRSRANPAGDRGVDDAEETDANTAFTRDAVDPSDEAHSTTLVHSGERKKDEQWPVFPKVHRRYLDVDTLAYYGIPFERDRVHPDYFILLRQMDKHETDILFEHTRKLRSAGLDLTSKDVSFFGAEGQRVTLEKKSMLEERELLERRRATAMEREGEEYATAMLREREPAARRKRDHGLDFRGRTTFEEEPEAAITRDATITPETLTRERARVALPAETRGSRDIQEIAVGDTHTELHQTPSELEQRPPRGRIHTPNVVYGRSASAERLRKLEGWSIGSNELSQGPSAEDLAMTSQYAGDKLQELETPQHRADQGPVQHEHDETPEQQEKSEAPVVSENFIQHIGRAVREISDADEIPDDQRPKVGSMIDEIKAVRKAKAWTEAWDGITGGVERGINDSGGDEKDPASRHVDVDARPSKKTPVQLVPERQQVTSTAPRAFGNSGIGWSEGEISEAEAYWDRPTEWGSRDTAGDNPRHRRLAAGTRHTADVSMKAPDIVVRRERSRSRSRDRDERADWEGEEYEDVEQEREMRYRERLERREPRNRGKTPEVIIHTRKQRDTAAEEGDSENMPGEHDAQVSEAAVANSSRWAEEQKRMSRDKKEDIASCNTGVDSRHPETAIERHQEALDATPDNHPDQAGRLQSLGVEYSDRYQRTKAMPDLETAIQLSKEALDATPDGHPDRVGRLKSLGAAYSDRYHRTGAMPDLETAIQYHQEALNATPDSHPHRAGSQKPPEELSTQDEEDMY
ncbi:hypothetical protein LTS10_002892 [Elasticomyces elasticus]|nr:hypothetical protein LTS10_002892 [Elasticomyces elasticus]